VQLPTTNNARQIESTRSRIVFIRSVPANRVRQDSCCEQVAAPAVTRTPNLHRAKIAPQECGWKDGDNGDPDRKEENLAHKTKNKRTDLTPIGLLMEGFHVLYRICTTSGANAKVQ